MNIAYSQSSGYLLITGDSQVHIGYSGHGPGLNNPELQSEHNVGPIPQGLWQIGEPIDKADTGPFSIPLTPLPGTVTYGRCGFFMHGDDISQPGQHLASDGCIILPRPSREAVELARATGDNILEVTE